MNAIAKPLKARNAAAPRFISEVHASGAPKVHCRPSLAASIIRRSSASGGAGVYSIPFMSTVGVPRAPSELLAKAKLQSMLLGQVSMDTLAHQLGTLDVARFARCSADSTKVPQIEAAIADANELGIRGTPAVIIGGMFRNGVPDIKDLERRVADARNRRTIVP